MAASEPDPIAELQRAMEVGFAKLDGRLNVIDTKLDAVKTTQKAHAKELEESRSRRWPLPVLGVLGAVGGLAAAAWSASGKQ